MTEDCAQSFYPSDDMEPPPPPRDKFNLAYMFLLLHGIGFLLPWNVFINAREYFVDYKLNTTTSIDADYRINFMSYIGFAAQFPTLCFGAWNTFCQGDTKSSSPVGRFLIAMAVEISVLIFTIILTVIDTSHVPGTFFGLTIATVVLINCCVGTHQTLTFGFAAILPMKYSNAVIVGANACGFIISVTNILTKLVATAEGRTPRAIVTAAITYFLCAVAIVIACVITYFWLRRLPFTRYYLRMSSKCIPVSPPELNDASTVTLGISATSNTEVPDSNGNRRLVCNYRRPLHTPHDGADPAESLSLLGVEGETTFDESPQRQNDCCLCLKHRGSSSTSCARYCSRYSICFSECWTQCLNIWCVFFCSLAVFPAIQSMVKPSSPDYFIPPTWFTDITCFLCFNFFAMLGCIVCNWVQFPGPRYLWIPVWIRLLFFIPFFLFCQFDLDEPKLPVLIANDHVYVFGVIVFAFTNGYLASLGMMYAPSNSPPERQELAGMLASLSLILGVCTGVYASRGFVSLII